MTNQKITTKRLISESSAVYNPFAHIRLWLLTFIGLSLDLWTKRLSLKHLQTETGSTLNKPVFGDWFSFELAFNPGAAWSIGAGKTKLLIGISILALVFLAWLFITSRRNQKYTHLALGMLLGGALGNIHDRIFNNGYVIDFLKVDFGFAPFNPWPIFNIADTLLCIGVSILMLCMILDKGHKDVHNSQEKQ